MKQGVFEIQFNWIFVLIAGGIILFFFLTIIGNQQKSSDEAINIDIVQRLDTILVSTEQSFQTYKELELVTTKLTFSCEEGDSELLMGSFSVPTSSQVLFAPAVAKDRKFQLWTQVWDQPYRVMPFLYITTPHTRFVIVNDSDGYAEGLYNALPANITKVLVDESDIGDYYTHDYDYSIAVFFDNSFNVPAGLAPKDKRLPVINIRTNVSWDQYGMIDFFYVSNPTTPFDYTPMNSQPYLGKEMIYGALFTADPDLYSCTVKKALDRYKLVTALQESRADKLQLAVDAASNREFCLPPLDAATIILDRIRTNIHYSITNFTAIAAESARLGLANDDLVRGRRCPLVY